jgi:transposase InsO family protein
VTWSDACSGRSWAARDDNYTCVRGNHRAPQSNPFEVQSIQTDNGSEFQSGFHWHLLDRGIRHVYIKPLTPRLNGKVERSHRIDNEEFYRQLGGVVIDSAELFNDKLQGRETFYNYARPHGSLGGQTPYERLRQKTSTSV